MKFFALVAAMIPATLMQTRVAVALGTMTGVRVPLGIPIWSWYVVSLALADTVPLAFHIRSSVICENQPASAGTGLVGGFITLYMFLMPGVARVIPRGYYVVITPVAMATGPDGLVSVLSPQPWSISLVLFGAAAFARYTKRLDQVERRRRCSSPEE